MGWVVALHISQTLMLIPFARVWTVYLKCDSPNNANTVAPTGLTRPLEQFLMTSSAKKLVMINEKQKKHHITQLRMSFIKLHYNYTSHITEKLFNALGNQYARCLTNSVVPKIPIPTPQGRSLEIPRSQGAQRPRKGKYEAKLKFPEGLTVQTKT